MTSSSGHSEPSPALRASDADRERVADALRRHHVAGRIDTDELQERLDRCYAARTGGELAVLLADLPEDSPGRAPRPSAAGHHPRAPMALGVLLLFAVLATVGAVTHGHVGPLPFLAVLLALKLAWGGPRRRRTVWGARG